MVAKRIIPCLDVDHGRVVKGVNFRDLEDAGDPVALAQAYDRQGADELTFLDVSASHEGREILLDTVQEVARQVFVPLTVGGGLRSLDDMARLLEAGADKIALSTAAVENPDLIGRAAARFGSQFVVLSLDARPGEGGHYEVTTHGGRNPRGIDAEEWARQAVELGAGEVLLNAMDADGTRAGFALGITRRMATELPVPVIASGGAGQLEDFHAVLTDGAADAALAASVFHFGQLTVGQVKEYLDERGVEVRR